MPSTREEYQADGLTLRHQLMSPDLVATSLEYLRLPSTQERFEPDGQVPGTRGLYGDPFFDALLSALTPIVGETIGVQTLAPAYTYLREYVAESALEPHVDRNACEHSVTVTIDPGDGEPWPIWMRDLHGVERGVTIPRGAGLCYRGCELLHWREPCAADRHIQIFLHYIDTTGPFESSRHDGRHALGVAPADRDPQGRDSSVEKLFGAPPSEGRPLVINDRTGRLGELLERAKGHGSGAAVWLSRSTPTALDVVEDAFGFVHLRIEGRTIQAFAAAEDLADYLSAQRYSELQRAMESRLPGSTGR